jgi:hypothetical protein
MSSCLSQLSQLYPELKNVWIKHFSPFILSDPFHVCTWRQIVIEEMEMFFDEVRRDENRSVILHSVSRFSDAFHDWWVMNHFKATDMCTQSRMRAVSNGTCIVHIWTRKGMVSKYVIDYPNHSLHQTCIRQYVIWIVIEDLTSAKSAIQLSTSDEPSWCAVCLSVGNRLSANRNSYFQIVETTERFPVCIYCLEGKEYLKHGVLCRQQDVRSIYSEVVAIDS